MWVVLGNISFLAFLTGLILFIVNKFKGLPSGRHLAFTLVSLGIFAISFILTPPPGGQAGEPFSIVNDILKRDLSVSKDDKSSGKANEKPSGLTGYVTGIEAVDLIDVRLENGKEVKVRLAGMELKESNKKLVREALDFAKETVLGKDILVELDIPERDKEGNLIGYIWLAKPTEINMNEIVDKMYNAVVLMKGYSKITVAPSNLKYGNYYTDIEKSASGSKAGLWALAENNLPVNPQPASPPAVQYIGNSNSKRFHRLDCIYAPQVTPDHRVELFSRDEAINNGFYPCKTCNP